MKKTVFRNNDGKELEISLSYSDDINFIISTPSDQTGEYIKLNKDDVLGLINELNILLSEM